jgi:NAD-dependent dihydropyrimidine dehydrogenase PreA subunit
MTLLPRIKLELCDGCGICVDGCPVHAVNLVNGKAAIARPEECDYCTECEALCPQQAISCPLEIVVWHPES